MSTEKIAEVKLKCLEIAQLITANDNVETKAKELFDWCTKI
jgi:hypothetical protein